MLWRVCITYIWGKVSNYSALISVFSLYHELFRNDDQWLRGDWEVISEITRFISGFETTEIIIAFNMTYLECSFEFLLLK